MQVKKIPLRRCVGCMTSKPKKELWRVVRTPEGEILLDTTGRRNGRGAYLCHSAACFAKARKARKLNAALGQEIPAEVFAALEAEMAAAAGEAGQDGQ